MTLDQVASATGTTEAAARKRLRRAVDRLRKALIATGVSSSTLAGADFAALLSGRAVEPPPAQLLARASHSAIQTAPSLLYFGTSLMIAVKLAVAAAVLLGASLLFRQLDISPATQAATSSDSPASQPVADWHTRFHDVYALHAGEFIKNVPPPFIPERDDFLKENPQTSAGFTGRAAPGAAGQIMTWSGGGTGAIPPQLQQMIQNGSMVESDSSSPIFIEQSPDGRLRRHITGSFMSSGGLTAGSILKLLLPRSQPGQIQDDSKFMQTRLPGDWVVRGGATDDLVVRGLAKIIGEKLNIPIAVNRATVDQDAVIVAGVPNPAADNQPVSVQLVLPGNGNNGVTGPLSAILRTLSEQTGYTFIDQGGASREYFNLSITGGNPGTKLDAQSLTNLLKSLNDQTGLTCRRETRPLSTWVLKPAPATRPIPAAQLP